ncbi:hypothetical protein [Polyangium sorediatum]|uniref:Cupin type-1 domain-containing protein n=1 Tax=Polyangium sorediatum TaxID=889274 RepID=A0ABT6NN45_9BACT|nr:hypothetical protein [Polyangium sorediatum]MDI1429723.1 hypothetical protein [Polyangium sorediatum]
MPSEPRTFVLGSRPTAAGAPRAERHVGRRVVMGACLATALAALARYTFLSGSAAGRRSAENVFQAAREASQALAAGRVSPATWQDLVEHAFRGASPEEIARAIDVESLVARAPAAIRGAAVVPFSPPLPEDEGPRIVTKLFVLRAGRANPPHAHDNMVSMHYVLRGRFRVRHYDRVRDEPGGIVLRPTIDRILGPGEATSISDARDNVHWHVAETDGVLLDVLCADLGSQPTDTHLVDPVHAEPLEGGLLRAPRFSTVGEALERFG